MKKKLYLDFDNTITDSPRAFLKAYNFLYENTGKEETLCWNFEDCKVAKDKIPEIFESAMFFTFLKPYPNAIEMIKELAQITDVSICTIGSFNNIKTKLWWLQCHDLDKYVGITPIVRPPHQQIIMNKSIIQDGILVDDNPICLSSCWAEHKVLFSWQDKPYDWQKDYAPQYKMTAWDDKGYELLLKLIKGEE